MKSVTWTQVAQYIILIISYLVPVVYLSWAVFSIPIPELTYGQLLQQNNATGVRHHRGREGEGDPRPLAGRTRTRPTPRSRPAGCRSPRSRSCRRRQRTAPRQASALASSETAKFSRYLRVPSGDGHVELPRADLLPHGGDRGAATHPDAVLHHAIGEAGTHLGCVVPVLHLPALLHGAGLCRVRAVRHIREAGRREDRRAAALGDPLAASRAVQRGRQERRRHRAVGGLRHPVHGLRRALDAGDRRAAVRDHRSRDGRGSRGGFVDGRRAPAHDRERDLARPLLQRHQSADLAGHAADDHEDPARRHRHHLCLRGHLPLGDHRRAGGLGLQPRGRVFLPGSGHGHLVEASQQGRGVLGDGRRASRSPRTT